MLRISCWLIVILHKNPAAFLCDINHMLDRVLELKKLILIVALLLTVFLKILIPANAALVAWTMSILGLDQHSIQTLGRGLREAAP